MAARPPHRKIKLPLGLRFESIGGLGANLAAQMVAETLVLRQGLNASQFSSYGSEKKGSVVRSFIRVEAAHRPIRDTSPIDQPDIVAVFHPSLLSQPETLGGLRDGGVAVINAPLTAPVRLPFRLGRVFLVDATAIAAEEQTRLNTAMMGALARAHRVFDVEKLAAVLSEVFGKKSLRLAEANVKTFRRGYREAVERLADGSEEVKTSEAKNHSTEKSFRRGYVNAPLGGAIFQPGSTAQNDLSASRQGLAPRWKASACTHCGLCDLVCPDYCLVWKASGTDVRLRGVDYQYCKGCLRCVETCPSGALAAEPEGPWMAEEKVSLWVVKP